MRDIKFRAISRAFKNWCFGHCFFDARLGGFYMANLGTTRLKVDPETIGQYTGLKDKNGKDCFEGDIIERDASNGSGNVKGEIIFDNGAFRIKWYGKGQWNGVLCIHLPDSQIIGNRFEHPELLNP